jgi:drug/metabolite transporter (DMT)-like permease
MQVFLLILLFLSAVLIAVGDAFLKKAGVAGSFLGAFRSPWFYGALILYLVQILAVVYIFFRDVPLGIVGTGLTFVYAVVMVFIGYYFFEEKFSGIHLVGAMLGLAGVFLMTYKI